jgi:hypothetical protein
MMSQCNHCHANLKVDYHADDANVVVADADWQSLAIIDNH